MESFLKKRKCKGIQDLTPEIMMSDWSMDDKPILKPAEQESKRISIDDMKAGMSRSMEYIMPIANPIGPPKTKCLITEKILALNRHHYVCLEVTTQTPDAPSGGSFHTIIRTCLFHAGPFQTKILCSYSINFTKSSWIKSLFWLI